MKHKIRSRIAVFIIVLILSIPFIIADNTSQITSAVTFSHGLDKIEVPDPDEICTQKLEVNSEWTEALEADWIQELERLISIMYSVSILINAVKSIVSSLCIWPGCKGGEGDCKIPYTWVCSLLEAVNRFFNGGLYPVLSSIFQLFFFCATDLAFGGNDLGLFKVCPTRDMGKAWDQMLAPTGEVQSGGSGLDPFASIYVAIACGCPAAILFNVRKLRIIHQTFDCCIRQACAAGVSTEHCYTFLDEATCMFWEGSLYMEIYKYLVQLVAQAIIELVSHLVAHWINQQGLEIAWNLYRASTGIKTAMDTWKDIQDKDSQLVEDIDCSVLGVDMTNIKEQMQNQPLQQYELTQKDGVYRSVTNSS